MAVLFILNDAPYGSERPYNGVRLANSLAKQAGGADITIFLMGDAVLAAKTGQKTPDGFYNMEGMLRRFVAAGGRVVTCGLCIDARGLALEDLIGGAARGTMDELAGLTLAADKVLVF